MTIPSSGEKRNITISATDMTWWSRCSCILVLRSSNSQFLYKRPFRSLEISGIAQLTWACGTTQGVNLCTLPHAKWFRKRRCIGKGKNTKDAEPMCPRRARSATPLMISYCRLFPSCLRHMCMRSFCKSSSCVHTITLNSYITYVKVVRVYTQSHWIHT